MKENLCNCVLLWIALAVFGCSEYQSGAQESVPGDTRAEAAGEPSSVEVAPARVLSAGEIRAEKAPIQTQKVAPSTRASRTQRAAGATDAKLAPTRRPPASKRVPPPKGLDAYADFVGARVGLIHTANVMGEIDPCG